MKVEIKNDGTLTVTAESELESYALDKWSDEYFKDSCFGDSKLLIVCIEDSDGQ